MLRRSMLYSIDFYSNFTCCNIEIDNIILYVFLPFYRYRQFAEKIIP